MAITVIFLLIAGLVAGCSSGKASPGSDSSSKPKNVLKVGWDWDVTPTDPVKSAYFYQRAGILETLVDIDFNGNLKPGLATAWECLSPTAWKFTLRPGGRFHDGTSLDSKAVMVLEAYSARPELPVIAEAIQLQLGARYQSKIRDQGNGRYKSLMSKGYDMLLMARGLAFTPDPSVALDDFQIR